MASVPNMPFASTGLPAGVATPPEGEVSNLFASLMPALGATPVIGEGVPVVPTVSLPAVLEGDAFPAQQGEEGEDSDADGESLPFADFLPLVQAQSNYPVAVTRPVVAETNPAGETVSTQADTVSASVSIPVASPQPAAEVPTPVVQMPIVAAPTAASNGVANANAAPPVQAPSVKPAVTAEAQKPVDVAVAGVAVTIAPQILSAAQTSKGTVTIPVKTVPAETPGVAEAAPAMTEIVAKLQEKPATRKSTEATPAPTVSVQASAAPVPTAPVLDISFVTQTAPANEAGPLNRAAEPAPTPDLAVEHELDLAHEGEWLDQLARDIARSGGSETPMRFRLNPQTLGHLQVELAQGDQGTHVRLTVETEAARAILADAQPKLMAEARAQGVRIAGAEVDLAGSSHNMDQHRQDARQADGRTPTFLRTARGEAEASASADAGSAPSDRYA